MSNVSCIGHRDAVEEIGAAASRPVLPRDASPAPGSGIHRCNEGGGGMMLRRIAFAVAVPVALVVTVALATAASSRSTAKVGSAAGGRDGQQVRCRHREEGHRCADQARRHRHADPRRRLHDDREGRKGLLRLRQRQRRHQGPTDQVHPLQRAAEPGAGGCAGAEADRERQGRRRRRQHELRRVRRQLEVLQVQGLPRDRGRRPGRVLRDPVDRSSRTWARGTATSVLLRH